MTNAYQYGRNGRYWTDFIYCVVIGSGTFVVTTINSAKIGLVIITIERYFKVIQHISGVQSMLSMMQDASWVK